jgi:hypothetical protein
VSSEAKGGSTLSALTREEKLSRFNQLAKRDGIKTGCEFAESWSNKACLLIDHPRAYRDWDIVGASSIPGFYRMESSFRLGLDHYEDRVIYTTFKLCLHESEFERIR